MTNESVVLRDVG